MAMEWYYVANQQQAGPVELATLQQMIRSGALSGADMVYGPGMSQWLAASQVPALAGAAHAPQAAATPYGGASTLGYQGTDTGTSGISQRALDMLRQTKPWTRFFSILIFIFVGIIVLVALGMLVMGLAMSSSRMGFLPALMALVYLGMAALYFMPGLFLTRFCNGVGDLARTNRMSDLERALEAQKSYWKFIGIATIIVMCIYALIGIYIVAVGSRF